MTVPAPLTINLVQGGFAVALDMPVDDPGPLVAEWAADGAVVATTDLTPAGGGQWAIVLTEADAAGLEAARVRHARVRSPRGVLLAGRVRWWSGWSGACPEG